MRPGYPEILYEDNHIIIVNKRSSDLVQGDGTGDESLDNIVREYIKEKYNKPGDVFLGVIHRLDRPVSGCVVYARTSKALTRLSELFRSREVRKTYWAIVSDRPPAEEGELSNYLKKNEKQNKSYVYDNEVKGSKGATLSYRILARSERYYLLEIDLHTGRHHQIRAQLAAAGCPVRGDLKYGARRSNEGGGISLHSRRVTFIHPVKKLEITAEAPLPDDKIWKLFKHV
ncbi:MAG: RluA family pseudouridine synthase [Bacteroidales bacterium]|jgi:23S rRNA pseudouridine1911/1915/1917 synthase|nr:RluA family pseudouridine synthase [Bacteroidales bacterium]NLD62919.1 RluA family pseudouridine synthase [Bacteroidales bacterium]HNT92921.1 RluA family pseudouridine synthase [Bacteroidales bacterium]HOO66880.1 RluA family pseudouridine synthase [Bacteroidales bacterium]HPE22829.1 RluA family pseudouridine synthase [Bacteroidales bacterium]